MIGTLQTKMMLKLVKLCAACIINNVKLLLILFLIFYASVGSYYSQCVDINFTVTITSDFNGAPTSCPNACDGELTVAVSSAGGPFGYTLTEQTTGNTTIQNTPVFSNLCGSGNYTITVTDTAQEVIPNIFWCQSSQGIAINDPLLPVPSFGFQSTPTCAGNCDGILQGVGSLGTGSLTLSWPELGLTGPPGQNNYFLMKLI